MEVVAFKDEAADTYTFNPSRKTFLTFDHTLIVMGDVDRMRKAAAMMNPA